MFLTCLRFGAPGPCPRPSPSLEVEFPVPIWQMDSLDAYLLSCIMFCRLRLAWKVANPFFIIWEPFSYILRPGRRSAFGLEKKVLCLGFGLGGFPFRKVCILFACLVFKEKGLWDFEILEMQVFGAWRHQNLHFHLEFQGHDRVGC